MARIIPIPGPPPPSGAVPVHPSFVVTRTLERAPIPLPGAGAFTAQVPSAVPLGTRRVTYWITYTRGAAGGFPRFRLEIGNGVEILNPHVLDAASLAPTAPTSDFATSNIYREEILGPVPPDAGSIDYELSFELPPATTQMRLLAAEGGVPATPGSCGFAFTGSNP